MPSIPAPIAWTSDHGVRILDQTRLPEEERYVELRTIDDVAEAIRTLRVRGAPLIGIAAAMGVAGDSAPRCCRSARPCARCATPVRLRPGASAPRWRRSTCSIVPERALT